MQTNGKKQKTLTANGFGVKDVVKTPEGEVPTAVAQSDDVQMTG